MTELLINDLTIEYTQGDYLVRPIESLNVSAADGELVILLGPSGSGKTTLLSCLAGILTPSAGRILVGDVDVIGLRGPALSHYRRHTVGIVFQAFNLIPSLTARENVMAPLRLAGMSARAARARAEELLASVGLEDRMNHRPRALSGGQQQRVAIARALVHEPPLLLADEPTAHLDYVQVEEVVQIIRGLATAGRLVIIATHDDRLIPLADRTIDLSPKAALGAEPPSRLRLEPGDQLFRQGEPSDFVYVVDEGEIDLLRDRPDRTAERLRTVGPGSYFGELGPLLGLPRSATARARTVAVVTGYRERDFRQRAGPRAVISRSDWLDRIRSAMERGEYLLAFDAAIDATKSYPEDVELQYHTVLALARAGATDQALAILTSSALEARVGQVPARLHEDVAALRARLTKDRALATHGSERQARAREAAGHYEEIYQRLGRPYSCINAATMYLVAGDETRSARLAVSAMELSRQDRTDDEPSDRYWGAATQAEAALLLDDLDSAADALNMAAAEADGDLAALATTRRQLLLVCSLKGIDTAVLSPLAVPTVVHYGGHMMTDTRDSGRFPAEAEAAVAGAINEYLERQRVGFGFGSLASGADILFAEALLARDAELHVVLPFTVEEFKEVSVRPGGTEWLARFDRCLGLATSLTQATHGEYLSDDSLFEYGSQVAMGHALIRAAFLAAPVEQVVVWDGSLPSGRTGTAADMKTWQAGGRRTHVIDVPGHARTHVDAGSATAPSQRVVRAMLFADVKGFSKLSDSQTPAFLASVMAPLADTLDRFDSAVLLRNSWGDGVYVVLRDVTSAARCALALQDKMRQLRPADTALPEGLGLRIGGHAGPVFEAEDPVRRERNFYGVEVTRTARIEPRTPEGEVYVTDPFAALIALEAEDTLSCQYVGHIPTAKDYGTFPMYVLKRRT